MGISDDVIYDVIKLLSILNRSIVPTDHPRSAFRGLNSDLKSLVRRINISGDIAM